METKYDWSGVPSEVKWIATDEDGVKNGFMKKPIICNNHKMWFENKDWTGDYVQLDFRPICDDNWQDSLEERPQ